MTIGSEGNINNPTIIKNPVGLQVPPNLGYQGEALNSDIHGKHWTAGYNKNLFNFNVTGVQIPVVASGLVSVFTLFNPPSSGVMGELVDTEMGQVLATTVVDTVGWYFSSGNLALAGTFTTKGIANTNYFSARTGDVPNGQIVPYSAYTHSGTPVRCDIIGAFGAVTDASFALPQKFYDGRILIPPGVALSVAMSTAASGAANLDLSCRWTEWPF